MSQILSIQGLSFGYGPEPLLTIPQFSIEAGERVFLRGESGSGKSTFLSLVTGILSPQQGSVSVGGTDLATKSGAARDQIRAEKMGIIFQLFNLLPYLSVAENVRLGAYFSKERQAHQDRSVEDLLAGLGLDPAEYGDRLVGTLSVGEQQRVAAARALLGDPSLIIADEPTSALDADRKADFIAALFGQIEDRRSAVLFVSHDTSLAPLFDRTVNISEFKGGV